MNIYDKARDFAGFLKASDEYAEYKLAKEKAFENETTKVMLKELHSLQIKAQAAMVSGSRDEESMQKLQKLGELLQMNADAAAYIMAEYRLNRMLGEVYKILGEAVDVDLGLLKD